MRFVFIFIGLFFMHTVFANTQIKTQIHDIDVGTGNEPPLIFLTSGNVISFPDWKKHDLEILRSGMRNKTWFLIEFNENRELVSLREVPAPEYAGIQHEKDFFSSTPYTPSILKNIDDAKKLFKESRANARAESQCFNRAHVWSYEWRKKHNLYSSKAWIFFTKKYIRKYKFEWWFHVAPMVYVVQDGEVKERIMDIKYSKGPLKLKQWTDIFMRDSAHCRVVQKYTDQANYPESGSCFVMKSSMYYYQPVDLELLEILGQEKTRWLEPEVRHAYLDAFDIVL